MHYFLDINFDPATGILNKDESHHAIKSLRVAVGDHIAIGDGKGNKYLSAISEIKKDEIQVNIISTETIALSGKKLTIAIAPTKNPSRFEWFLEKATELGVYKIIPILAQNSERPRLKLDRAHRIIHAATKQTMRAHIPVLEELTPLASVFKSRYSKKYIAHCHSENERENLPFIETDEEIIILIGPEGDFSVDEVKLALENNFTPVVLGNNRLRTETAGIYVAAHFFA